MTFRRLATAALVVAALVGSAFWMFGPVTTAAPGGGRSADGGSAVPVVIGTAEERTVPITVGVIGTVEATATVSVRSRVDGQLVSKAFEEGQLVKQGDLLFTIDPRPFQAQLAQAEAALARDQAQVESARKNRQRYDQLSKEGVSSLQQAEQAVATEKAAMATVKADEAAIQSSRLQLEYTEIRSPVDGRTGSILVDVGNVVRANDTNPLVTINRISPIYVTFSVPEKYLPQIRQGMAASALEVTAEPAGSGATPEIGRVTFVNNAADPTTGTIQLKGTFANEDEGLTPGQLVDTVLTLATLEHAVTVPDSAIQNSQRGAAVFVVKQDMTVELRPVTIVVSQEGYTVVDGGIAAGDRVVLEGQLRLTQGTKVRAVDAAPDA